MRKDISSSNRRVLWILYVILCAQAVIAWKYLHA